MRSLEEIKSQRFAFMKEVYRATGASPQKVIEEDDVGKALTFTGEETKTISRYLEDEALIQAVSQQGAIAITHKGIKEMEGALSAPDRPTDQIQLGSPGGQQVYVTSAEGQKQIADFIERLKETIPSLKLSHLNRSDLEANRLLKKSVHTGSN